MKIINIVFGASLIILTLAVAAKVGMSAYEQVKMTELLEYQATHCEPMG